MNLNLYRKQYVVVPVQRPTFVFTCKGKFLRVDNYIYKLPKAGSVAQETWLVSDHGLCFMYDGREMQIFTAPVTPIDLTYYKKIATGLFHFEPRYFDQRCGELGIVIEE